jgi:hypothetical protein
LGEARPSGAARESNAALVVDRHRGLVGDGALDVVDADVIAEDRPRVRVRLSMGVPVKPMKLAFGKASRMCRARPSMRSYCERCASSAMTMMFRRGDSSGIFSPFSGRNF